MEQMNNHWQHNWESRWLKSVFHRLLVRRRVSRFFKICPEPFRGEALEVGAGQGWTSRRILEMYPQVELTATDIDQAAITTFDKMSRHYGRRLIIKQADVLGLPFDRSSFDVVVVDHALHYVDDYEKAVQQLLRVVRPGGMIGIIGSNWLGQSGIMRWLWSSAGKVEITKIEDTLKAEDIKVLASRRGIYSYCLWARKRYPTDSEKIQVDE
jgi:ubiquinone/menaquinone biosynthesis C-methylase UbiE